MMSNRPTVFVVDDDQAMRNSLKWLIESVSMQVETFESADAFINSYYPGRSGCLLLDVRMPGMSGLELQEYLRENQIAIPVIIITGHGDVPMAVRAMKSERSISLRNLLMMNYYWRAFAMHWRWM